MKYKVGDLVLHKIAGICEVTAIDRHAYELKPMHDKNIKGINSSGLYTPAYEEFILRYAHDPNDILKEML